MDEYFHEEEEKETYFDIRSGLYQKTGGIKQLLELIKSIPVDIPIYGTKIKKEHLGFILSEHNEKNPDKKITINDENNMIVYNSKITDFSKPNLDVLDLEENVISALEIIQKTEKLPEGTFGAEFVIKTQEKEGRTEADTEYKEPEHVREETETKKKVAEQIVEEEKAEQLKSRVKKENITTDMEKYDEMFEDETEEEQTKIEEDRSIMLEYINIICRGGKNISDLDVANSLLQELIHKYGDHFTKRSLEDFIYNSKLFMDEYEHTKVFDMLESFFNYLRTIDKKKFTGKSLEYANWVRNVIQDLLHLKREDFRQQRLEFNEKLASINKYAFETFIGCGDHDRVIGYVQKSLWNYFGNIERILWDVNNRYEKEEKLNEAIKYAKKALNDDDVPGDVMTSVNIKYYLSVFNFEYYQLSKQKSFLHASKAYLKEAKQETDLIEAYSKAEKMLKLIERLERRM